MQKCILAFALSFAATTAVIDSPTTWIINQRIIPADSPLVACTKIAPGDYSVVGYSANNPPVTFSIKISTDVGPGPLPPIDPTPRPVDPSILNPAAKATSNAWRDYSRTMAANYDSLGKGQYATVADAAGESVKLDEAARAKLKADMRRIMEPALGSGDMPANGQQLFRDMAAGFREVAK